MVTFVSQMLLAHTLPQITLSVATFSSYSTDALGFYILVIPYLAILEIDLHYKSNIYTLQYILVTITRNTNAYTVTVSFKAFKYLITPVNYDSGTQTVVRDPLLCREEIVTGRGMIIKSYSIKYLIFFNL